MLATLDINNPSLRLDLMNSLVRRPDLLKLMGRSETDPRPSLWYLSAKSDVVGQKAKEIVATLVGVPVGRLASPVAELIKAADEVYQHKATYSKSADAPLIWKWDGKKLISIKGPPTLVEEHYGLRYSRWALELDPKNEMAQALFLSVATEKAMERVGLDQRLAQAAPAVHDLLALAPANVLYTMLDMPLVGHTPWPRCHQVLGERSENKGVKLGASGPSPTRNMDVHAVSLTLWLRQ